MSKARILVFAIILLAVCFFVVDTNCKNTGFDGVMVGTSGLFCIDGKEFLNGEVYNIRPAYDNQEWVKPTPIPTYDHDKENW